VEEHTDPEYWPIIAEGEEEEEEGGEMLVVGGRKEEEEEREEEEEEEIRGNVVMIITFDAVEGFVVPKEQECQH